jgi:hypothetical protein
MERYEIRVRGHLDARWSDWLVGLALERRPDGTTVLSGALPDQGALFGVLLKLRDLNIALLAVEAIPAEPPPAEQG